MFVAEVATKGQRVETVMEEKEQILKSFPIEYEHLVDSLTQWEMDLKVLEDWLDSPETIRWLPGETHARRDMPT
jgi:hypothetical protein